MARERDLFADFARMRRDMDQLFGVGLERPVPDARRRAGFSPAVDVYYMGEPPRAVVRAELAGIDPDTIALEIQGRQLVLAGHRRSAAADEGRVYQQVEIAHGPFRRVVSLGADVLPEQARAVYEDGILRIELPLAQPDPRPRTVPVQTPRS
jgi:HSP20 family protein